MICHEKALVLDQPATFCEFISHVDDPGATKKVGGIRVMNTRQGNFRYARIPVKAGQEMPSPGGASRVREIDRSFSSDVVLARNAFEIKIEQWMRHGSCLRRAIPRLMGPALSPIVSRAPRMLTPTSVCPCASTWRVNSVYSSDADT